MNILYYFTLVLIGVVLNSIFSFHILPRVRYLTISNKIEEYGIADQLNDEDKWSIRNLKLAILFPLQFFLGKKWDMYDCKDHPSTYGMVAANKKIAPYSSYKAMREDKEYVHLQRFLMFFFSTGYLLSSLIISTPLFLVILVVRKTIRLFPKSIIQVLSFDDIKLEPELETYHEPELVLKPIPDIPQLGNWRDDDQISIEPISVTDFLESSDVKVHLIKPAS